MAGEVFGEADIILRGRLDQFQRDLDQAELLIMQQQDRVVEAQQQAASSVRQAGQEAEKTNGILGDIVVAIARWRTFNMGLSLGRALLASIPVVATAAAAAAAAAVALLTVAVIATAGAIDQMRANFVQASKDVGDAYSRLDGTTRSTRELAEALRELPILGRLISFQFKLISGDAQLADEALTSLVATVEDGQVKISGWARYLGRGVGLGGFIDDIDQANRKLTEMNDRFELIQQFQQFTGPQAERVNDVSLGVSRSNELEGLDGLQRIRAENRIRHEEAMKFYEDESKGLNAVYSEATKAIEEQRKAGDINQKQARLATEALQVQLQTQQATIEKERLATSRQLSEQAAKRVEQYREEERQAQRVYDAETKRLQTQARAEEIRLGGNTLGAELLLMEDRRQDALTDAVQRGQLQRIYAINRYYNAVSEITRRAHQQELQDERRQNMQRLMLMREAQLRMQRQRADTLEGVRGERRVAELENAGQDFEARRQAVREEFRQRIEEAIRSGDRDLLEELQALRRQRLQGVDREERDAQIREKDRELRELQRRGTASAQQIDRANFAAGQQVDAKAEEKAIQKNTGKTNELLREYLTAGARAG